MFVIQNFVIKVASLNRDERQANHTAEQLRVERFGYRNHSDRDLKSPPSNRKYQWVTTDLLMNWVKHKCSLTANPVPHLNSEHLPHAIF